MADSTNGITYTNYQTPDNDFGILSGSINFTGLGSGSDFNSVIDQLVKLESIQKTRLETWRTSWQSKIKSMQSLNQRMEGIEEAAAAMDTEDEFMVKQASSSDSATVSATAGNSAKAGAYTVEVGQDIKHILRTAGVASTTTNVADFAGGPLTLTIETGGNSINVSVASGRTLSELKTDIENAVAAQAPGALEVSIENDGTDSNPYHLVMKATDGGADGRITVSANPTNLSMDYKDMSLQDGWGGASTAEIGLSGQFFGDKDTASIYEYVFQVSSSGSVQVGTTAFDLGVSVYDGATLLSSSTINVPADYVAGEALEVENGMFINLSGATVANGDSFTVRGFANDIDDAELGTWSGSTVTTGGNYLGTVNKTYSFTVVTPGTIQAGGGADTAVLRWTDSTGETGTVSISDSDQFYEVDQGVKLKLGATTLVNGDNFQVNVFAPDQQQGQDKGLAQVSKVVHSGFADQDVTAVTTSAATFSYTYGGETIELSVPEGKTLSQLVTMINGDEDNPGVVASVINDGLGLPDSYKLVLTGSDTGAQYQISSVSHDFSGNGFGNVGELGGGFTRSQWATNSMVKVDGYPSETDIYLQRHNNQVADVVDSVTFDLHNVGTAVVTISTDLTAVKKNIEAFINMVNYTQDFIRAETKFDPDGEETGILIGNYSYYILKSRIDTALNTSVSGLVDGEDTYTHLSQIGIQTDPDADGRWTIDSVTLNNALNEDPEAVANLFIENTTKESEGVAKRMHEEMQDLTDSETGTLNVLIDNYNGIIDNINKKIESEEKRIELFRQRQVERFARLEKNLAVLNAQDQAIQSQIAKLPGSGD